MKSKSLLITTALVATLGLAGCGGAKSAAEPPKPAPAAAPAPAPAVDIKAGVAKMSHELDELKEAVEKGDVAGIQKYAKETDEAWEAFEDAVKAKDKAAYEKIEEPLHAITAGAKAAAPDKKVLLEQIAKLDGLLDALEGGAPAAAAQPADIKSGTASMRHELAELKEAVEAGDAAKAQKYAGETDEAWEAFEDAVKSKDKAAYEKIEEPLHAIMAGVKAASLDKKVLGEQIAKLDALLADLVK